MGNKYSKQELKHWCDNCCCIDCRQTKKEKLECKRTRNPIKARIVEVDDVVEKPYLFEELQRDLKDRKVPNEKIYIGSQHIDFAEFENWKGESYGNK